jgi:uncharacterized coiled-coil protein SlyX
MDFKSLQPGQPVYIIYKNDNPRLVVAEVVSRNEPHFNVNNPSAAIGTSLKQVVDITAKNGEEVIPLGNLTADAEAATYNQGAQFIGASSESTLREVDRMMAESRAVLDKVDYHQSVLAEGEKMLEVLNPQYKEAKAQKQDIAELRDQMGQLMQMVADMQASLKSAKK